MLTQQEYEERERKMFERALTVPGLSATERAEAEAKWEDCLANNPELVAQRVAWLLDGDYGYGAYQAAHEVLADTVTANLKMNRVTWLIVAIGALEWQCKPSRTPKFLKGLSEEQLLALSMAVHEVIDRSY